MNAAHLHLILNHVPVLGTAFGLTLLAWALMRRSEELEKVSFGVLVIVALLAIPAYLTGEPAEEMVEHLPEVNHDAIEEHEDAATFAFAGVLVLGSVTFGGLIFFRRRKPIPEWLAILVLVLSVLVFAMMVRTAYLGGFIRHPELRPTFIQSLQDRNADPALAFSPQSTPGPQDAARRAFCQSRRSTTICDAGCAIPARARCRAATGRLHRNVDALETFHRLVSDGPLRGDPCDPSDRGLSLVEATVSYD
jgi:uncharacterized membrane protein